MQRRWPQRRIHIDLATQRLILRDGDEVLMDCRISSARNGPGECRGSECTPRGAHVIRAKIGAGQPVNTVFVGRRSTGEVYTPELAARFPGRDWILTRILWLSGLEPGRNRWGHVDTLRRYIYIHGTPDSVPMGEPGSRGCIRMRNTELLSLFDRVEAGTRVDIEQ